MPAILPSGDDHNNSSSSRSSSGRTLHSTSPPTENSFPCSYARTPKPPTRSLFKTPFTVTVGPDAQPFHVHREAFAAASPFFAACLNPAYAFREAAASTVHLPAARPTDFEYLVQWVYTGALDHEELDVDHPAYFRLIKLWLLADELAVEGCKNGVVDAMARVADRSNSVPTPDDTRTVFGEEGVREGAGLRGLVVDLFAWKKTDQLVEAHEDSWDETFMRALVCKLKRMDAREKGKAPWRNDADRCRLYHEHTTGQSTCGVLEAKRWAK
ncbi:MAG: hypothetical protein LQ345_006704 [Seirophora villosa]|nr:MAG: hypothetical protein LQ345_006704 [Seirophora villosa]